MARTVLDPDDNKAALRVCERADQLGEIFSIWKVKFEVVPLPSHRPTLVSPSKAESRYINKRVPKAKSLKLFPAHTL